MYFGGQNIVDTLVTESCPRESSHYSRIHSKQAGESNYWGEISNENTTNYYFSTKE